MSPVVALPVDVNAPSAEYSPEEDGLHLGRNFVSTVHLSNSVMLEHLPEKLVNLPRSSQRDIPALVKRFPSLFSDVPSRTTLIKHDIDVNDPAPIRQHPYQVNPTKHALMKQETEYLLTHGLAVPSVSPWCSPCLLVQKADSSFHFCTDYRRVNAAHET